jgi:hypothetical protein
LGCKGRGFAIQIDIDKATKLFDLNLIKTNIIGVEVFQVFCFGGAHKLAIKLVSPGMIWAHNARRGAFARQQFVGTVFTDIIKSPQFALAVAYHCNRMPGYLCRDICASFA